jgi:uncharacterized membrane protein
MPEAKLKNKDIKSEAKLKNQSITKPNKIVKLLPWILIICGIIGLLAASILTIEKIHIAANPNYVTSCSINPVFSCNNVIGSKEANALGFPNPFLGIAGFALVIGVGAMLLAGGRVKNKTYWRLFQIGPTLGFLFCIWLMNETLYEIGALCLYCMVTWFVTSIIFFSTTTYNHLVNDIFPAKLKGVADFISRHTVDLIGIYVLVCTGLILNRFWDFFSRSLF